MPRLNNCKHLALDLDTGNGATFGGLQAVVRVSGLFATSPLDLKPGGGVSILRALHLHGALAIKTMVDNVPKGAQFIASLGPHVF